MMIKTWAHLHGAPGVRAERKSDPDVMITGDKQEDEESAGSPSVVPRPAAAPQELTRKANPRGLPNPLHPKLQNGLRHPFIKKPSSDSDTDEAYKPLV